MKNSWKYKDMEIVKINKKSNFNSWHINWRKPLNMHARTHTKTVTRAISEKLPTQTKER